MVVQRKRIASTLAIIYVASLLAGFAVKAQAADTVHEPPSPLEFRIAVEKGDYWSPEWVYIAWELRNVSNSAVYVCQWPGPAFSHGWEYPEGVFNGTVPGYPHSPKLSRKFFVELKPGEAILGSTYYRVQANPTGFVDVVGHYRSGQTGKEHGLVAWQGEVTSESVTVEVPKSPPPEPETKEGSPK